MAGSGAVTSERPVNKACWSRKRLPMAAVKVYSGAAAVIDKSTGYVTNAQEGAGYAMVGIFAETVDNSAGSAGAKSVDVEFPSEKNLIYFDNGSSTDAIVAADRGKRGFFIDNQSVSIVGTNRTCAGIIRDVDSVKGVGIEMEDVSRGLQGAAIATFTAGALTIQPYQGRFRFIDTLAANSTLTIGTTGAVAGDQINIARATTGAYTCAIVNGGTNGGTLMTMSASKKAGCVVQFDGTDWRLVSNYQEA